jgi:tetratricopeptide (TPR) repeat protein
LLRQALAEYDEAAGAVPADDEYTWALINQNVCSIRQPLAAIEEDRARTMQAIGECEKALAYYEKHEEQEEQAAAHYNMARAYERLAEWDRDAGQATRAVEHVRRTVALYSAERLTLSRAMAEVHLAEALLDTADLTEAQNEERHAALRAEARTNLDTAEPILRGARASTYLGRLEDARARLGR